MNAIPAHRVSVGERLNTAETTGPLQQSVRKLGIRMTRQRQAILQVMDDAEQHLDVDQILDRAKKLDPEVHLVTVYRTIELLKKHALIDELDLLHLRRPALLRKPRSARPHSCGVSPVRKSAGIRKPPLRTAQGADCARFRHESHRVADGSWRLLRGMSGQERGQGTIAPTAGAARNERLWRERKPSLIEPFAQLDGVATARNNALLGKCRARFARATLRDR